jgi:hypothetical protein
MQWLVRHRTKLLGVCLLFGSLGWLGSLTEFDAERTDRRVITAHPWQSALCLIGAVLGVTLAGAPASRKELHEYVRNGRPY